jgi:hypothetical protein
MKMADYSFDPVDHGNLRTNKIVLWILALLEALLVFRLLFRLLGANPGSPFVSLIYSISQIFVMPFAGIFRSTASQGIETRSVLEPGTLIAMIVYALLAYAIIKFFEIYRTP